MTKLLIPQKGKQPSFKSLYRRAKMATRAAYAAGSIGGLDESIQGSRGVAEHALGAHVHAREAYLAAARHPRATEKQQNHLNEMADHHHEAIRDIAAGHFYDHSHADPNFNHPDPDTYEAKYEDNLVRRVVRKDSGVYGIKSLDDFEEALQQVRIKSYKEGYAAGKQAYKNELVLSAEIVEEDDLPFGELIEDDNDSLNVKAHPSGWDFVHTGRKPGVDGWLDNEGNHYPLTKEHSTHEEVYHDVIKAPKEHNTLHDALANGHHRLAADGPTLDLETHIDHAHNVIRHAKSLAKKHGFTMLRVNTFGHADKKPREREIEIKAMPNDYSDAPDNEWTKHSTLAHQYSERASRISSEVVTPYPEFIQHLPKTTSETAYKSVQDGDIEQGMKGHLQAVQHHRDAVNFLKTELQTFGTPKENALLDDTWKERKEHSAKLSRALHAHKTAIKYHKIAVQALSGKSPGTDIKAIEDRKTFRGWSKIGETARMDKEGQGGWGWMDNSGKYYHNKREHRDHLFNLRNNIGRSDIWDTRSALDEGYHHISSEDKTLYVETHKNHFHNVVSHVKEHAKAHGFDTVHVTTFGHEDKKPRERDIDIKSVGTIKKVIIKAKRKNKLLQETPHDMAAHAEVHRIISNIPTEHKEALCTGGCTSFAHKLHEHLKSMGHKSTLVDLHHDFGSGEEEPFHKVLMVGHHFWDAKGKYDHKQIQNYDPDNLPGGVSVKPSATHHTYDYMEQSSHKKDDPRLGGKSVHELFQEYVSHKTVKSFVKSHSEAFDIGELIDDLDTVLV